MYFETGGLVALVSVLAAGLVRAFKAGNRGVDAPPLDRPSADTPELEIDVEVDDDAPTLRYSLTELRALIVTMTGGVQ